LQGIVIIRSDKDSSYQMSIEKAWSLQKVRNTHREILIEDGIIQ
jgi:hypothetical protein